MLPSSSATATPVNSPLPTQTQTDVLGVSGHYAQWGACLIFVLATIIIAIHSTYVHRKTRIFHLVTVLLTACSALSYYAMATGSGTIFVISSTELHHSTDGGDYVLVLLRQIFYVRFIDFFFTTPLLLLNLALLCGLSWIDTLNMVLIDELVMVCVLMGAISHSSLTMWGWYGFMLLFFTFLFYILVIRGVRAAHKQPGHITGLYKTALAMTYMCLFPYVVVAALGDHSGHISVNTQMLIYTGIDLGLRFFIPIFIILGYQKHTDNIGHGPSALPDHLFDHRSHGWDGGVQLPGSD